MATSFTLPFPTLFSRKSRTETSTASSPTKHRAPGPSISVSGPPSVTQSLPGSRRPSQSPPTTRPRNHTVSASSSHTNTNPKPSPASTVRGHVHPAGGHGDPHAHVHSRSSGHTGGTVHSGNTGSRGTDHHPMLGKPSMSNIGRSHGGDRLVNAYVPYAEPGSKTQSQSLDHHKHSMRGKHKRHISRPAALPMPQPAPSPGELAVATPHSGKHGEEKETLQPSPHSQSTSQYSHTHDQQQRTRSIPTPTGLQRRYSENQIGRAAPSTYCAGYRPPASCSGHEVGGWRAPVSATLYPGPTDWVMEDEDDEGDEDDDDYDEDSEGPLDPLEVLESFYHEIPVPPWMAAMLDESSPTAVAHTQGQAAAPVPIPAGSSTPPDAATSAGAASPPTQATAASAPSSSRLARRSITPSITSSKDPRSPQTRIPFSLPLPARLRRNSSQNNTNSSDNSASGSNGKPGQFGYRFRGSASREDSDDNVPIHQRPLPPVPPTASGTLRQRLLRSRHASDVPDEASAALSAALSSSPSIPEHTEVSASASLAPAASTNSTSTGPKPGVIDFDNYSMTGTATRPSSVVNHIIPPEERARIGRRRYDSQSSISSEDSSVMTSNQSVQTLQLPLQLASMPSSPFGSTHALPRQIPHNHHHTHSHAHTPPAPAGLNPPPRPRSRMTPGHSRTPALGSGSSTVNSALGVAPWVAAPERTALL